MIKTLKKIILASGSQTRKKMLSSLGFDFEVIHPQVDEDELKLLFKKEQQDFSPSTLGLYLAEAKARAISQNNLDAYVIAADQICELDGEIFDKPGTKENAIEHLQKLSGKIHKQNSCTCIYYQGKKIWAEVLTAEIELRDLSEEEIKSYVELENPIHSAGAYMLEMHGKHIFKKITGDHDVILGLPVVEILNQLYEEGVLAL